MARVYSRSNPSTVAQTKHSFGCVCLNTVRAEEQRKVRISFYYRHAGPPLTTTEKTRISKTPTRIHTKSETLLQTNQRYSYAMQGIVQVRSPVLEIDLTGVEISRVCIMLTTNLQWNQACFPGRNTFGAALAYIFFRVGNAMVRCSRCNVAKRKSIG